MPLVFKFVSKLKVIQQLNATWFLLCYPWLFTCFALLAPPIFFKKRKTDMQCISSKPVTEHLVLYLMLLAGSFQDYLCSTGASH